jgi:hypothetical protein
MHHAGVVTYMTLIHSLPGTTGRVLVANEANEKGQTERPVCLSYMPSTLHADFKKRN